MAEAPGSRSSSAATTASARPATVEGTGSGGGRVVTRPKLPPVASTAPVSGSTAQVALTSSASWKNTVKWWRSGASATTR
ncbi:MAG: hypothetical protein R3F59_01330 [Myxococcota bacterium]